MDPGMMEIKTPPQASPPTAMDDTEVLSRRASLGHREVREAAKMVPEGNTSAAENMGRVIPMETDGGGPDQSGSQPNTAPETHTDPDPREQPPLKAGGVSTPLATSISPKTAKTLREALRRASSVDEHRTLMGMVVEKV